MDNARKAGGGQWDKREGREHETSAWQVMQGVWATGNTTKGGGRMTLHNVMGWWMTQQEARIDNTGQLNEAGVDNAGQLNSRQHEERRGMEDPTQRRTTH